MSLINVIPSITCLGAFGHFFSLVRQESVSPVFFITGNCGFLLSFLWLGKNQFLLFFYNWKFWFSPLIAVLAKRTWAGCVGTVVSSLFLLGHIIDLELLLCFIYCCLVFKFIVFPLYVCVLCCVSE